VSGTVSRALLVLVGVSVGGGREVREGEGVGDLEGAVEVEAEELASRVVEQRVGGVLENLDDNLRQWGEGNRRRRGLEEKRPGDSSKRRRRQSRWSTTALQVIDICIMAAMRPSRNTQQDGERPENEQGDSNR
jgi:hypothetical protein